MLGLLYLPTGGNYVAFVFCLLVIAAILLSWCVGGGDKDNEYKEDNSKKKDDEFERRVAEEVEKQLREYGITKDDSKK
jgi:membrane protein required for beta-lactamase induction